MLNILEYGTLNANSGPGCNLPFISLHNSNVLPANEVNTTGISGI